MMYSARASVLQLLEFSSNYNSNIVHFYYYFITLIGIGFGIRFSLESIALSYY